jgi:hypothetical protein
MTPGLVLPSVCYFGQEFDFHDDSVRSGPGKAHNWRYQYLEKFRPRQQRKDSCFSISNKDLFVFKALLIGCPRSN